MYSKYSARPVLILKDSGYTCWETLTLTSRHDVWTRRVILKKISCLSPLTVLWFPSWSSLRVYELDFLLGDTELQDPQVSWRHK